MPTKIISLYALILFSSSIYAENSSHIHFPRWKIEAETGSLWTYGNSKTSNINGNLNIERKGELWISGLKLSALHSTKDDKTNKEKYSGQFQVDRNFTDQVYLAMQTLQERDRFSGFYYQSTTSVGLGYRFFDTDTVELKAEFGPGYYREKLRDDAVVNSEFIARWAVIYEHKIAQNLTLAESLSYDLGSINKIVRSETSLRSQLNGHLAAKFSYKFKHTNDVAPDKENYDSELGLTLVLTI